MFTTFIQTKIQYEWLDNFHTFGNNYLINSDGSKVEKNQFNGSGVYEGKFVSSLRKEFKDICKANLSEIEVNNIHLDMRGALTNYVLDKENEKIFILPDPIGMSIIYYYITPQVKIYSTSIKEIQKYLKKMNINITKDIDFFFESLVMNNGGLGHTPYKEVNALKPFNYIEVSRNEIQIIENPLIIEYINQINQPNYKDVIDIAKEDIKKNITAVSNYKANGVKISHLTGGFDSRLILSAILNLELKDEFLFFCSGKDGTSDKDISKALCREFDLTFTNYSGYEITKPLESRIDGFLWSLDYTSGTNYEAHGNYEKKDNVILSGGLGLLYRSVYNLEKNAEEYDSYYELMKAKWPVLDNKDNNIFNNKFVSHFHSNFLKYIDESQKYKIPDNSLFDFIHMRYRSRYFTGQISFFLSSTNPRFDVLYSIKSFLNILFLGHNIRKSNIVGLTLLDEFHSNLKKYPFDSNKFNKDYIDLVGKPDTIEFTEGKELTEYTDYSKPNFKISKVKKNNQKVLQRANKLKATLWQVEDEEEAKEGLSKIVKNLPTELKSESLNISYIDDLVNSEIKNRIQLRRLHSLYRSFIWFN